MRLKIINVVGARPNFMKIAPLLAAYRDHPSIEPVLVHTGQHYDEAMSRLFFGQLGLPEPDINLGVGSGSHAAQTAAILTAFEPVLLEHRPDLVLVVGDVNSTIACGLAAVKLGFRLAHVEAGLRSGDRSMPEEINRVLTDAISDYLFCTERAAVENLLAEGIARERIFLVGNVMIDTLLSNRQRAEQSPILSALGLEDGQYVVATLHRPSNVDSPDDLRPILEALLGIAARRAVVFPIHPRTRRNFAAFGFEDAIRQRPSLKLVEPLGYLDFLKLMAHARAVLTDSGGIQEETTILGVPCLTLRRNTERPITVTQGTNRLVEPTRDAILSALGDVETRSPGVPAMPALWDGKAAGRICEILLCA